MKEDRNNTISDLCKIVSAKKYTLPANDGGRIRTYMYVGSGFGVGKTLAYFTSDQKNNGYYLFADNRIDLLYIAFILNSYLGSILLHNEGADNYLNGKVTKRNLSAVRIVIIPERYKKACNVLELIIQRITGLKVDDRTREIKDASVSFLNDMRNYICLEIWSFCSI